MKKVLALSLLFLFMACSQNEETFQEIKPKFHLPIGKKISTENLIAEVYFYENSETPKKVKEFNGLSLESDSGKLSLKHKEKIELDPGSYIMRIYLSHNTQGLFWIGEWDIKVKAGKTSEILKPKNTFK